MIIIGFKNNQFTIELPKLIDKLHVLSVLQNKILTTKGLIFELANCNQTDLYNEFCHEVC